MNKRGDIFQLVILVLILFIVAVVGLLMLTLSNKITETYNDMNLLNDTAIGQDANNMLRESGPRTTDYMIFFLFLGSVIGIMISASKTQFSTGTVFLFILLLVITIFISSGLVNIYSGFTETASISSSAEQLTYTNFIFSKYTPLILTVIGGLIMLIMWGKQGSDIVT